jgi:ubiquitin-like 1-activating enzyme E1 B
MASRNDGLLRALGAENVAKLNAAKVLVIGAGGIGCELLKNLVLSGFRAIEAIDLDTIDFSNLNRQFLFRKHHVNKSKSAVAKEAVGAFNPDVQLVAHHGNIKAKKFGLAYFSTFTIVLNALDNVSARRHVNRLCLQAGVPLIDAGTQGDLGQVKVISKGWSACYECEPPAKPITVRPAPCASTPHTTRLAAAFAHFGATCARASSTDDLTPGALRPQYAMCTVAVTPRKPVHCIEFAKQLYLYLFGGALRSNSLLWNLREDSKFAAVVDAAPRADATIGALRAYAAAVCTAIFHTDIKHKLSDSGDRYKNSDNKPTPLGPVAELIAQPRDAALPDAVAEQQRVRSVADSARSFVESVAQIWASRRAEFEALPAECESASSASAPAAAAAAVAGATGVDCEAGEATHGVVWDKDVDLDLEFATAAANLWATVFSITPRKSPWQVKSIAGAIIPAVATTNAIVAGLQTIEAIKVVCGGAGLDADARRAAACVEADAAAGRPALPIEGRSRRQTTIDRYHRASVNDALEGRPHGAVAAPCTVACNRLPNGGSRALLQGTRCDAPKASCAVCGNGSASVQLDTSSFTFSDLVEKVIRGGLGFNSPSVEIGDVELYYHAEQSEEPCPYMLRALAPPRPAGAGIGHMAVLTISDETQGDFRTNLAVVHVDGASAPRGAAPCATAAPPHLLASSLLPRRAATQARCSKRRQSSTLTRTASRSTRRRSRCAPRRTARRRARSRARSARGWSRRRAAATARAAQSLQSRDYGRRKY